MGGAEVSWRLGPCCSARGRELLGWAGLSLRPWGKRPADGRSPPNPQMRWGCAVSCRRWFLAFLCRFHPVTKYVQLEDDAVVNEPVDGGGGGHRVFEYLLPC